MHNTRNHKLTVANRAKRQTQRRPVDQHFQGFTPYCEMKVWSPDGSFEQKILTKEEENGIRASSPFN